MKVSNPYWKKKLKSQISTNMEAEIGAFETDISLRKKTKMEEKLFAETRLRQGAYGQRYDNGQRHNGKGSQTLEFPTDRNSKGPNTLWHAPGMQRIKIPYGGMNARQCEVMADLVEEYSDGIGHITTRQDFQLHFIHIDDTPSIMRRLASVGITTKEACGNSVRNITACPSAGCCQTEIFDVTPYADALTYFLLGHHDVQDFGRKVKIAFSGCKAKACGLTNMHDIGFIASKKTIDGQEKKGFELYVGGGLGAVPHPAQCLEEFIPEEELLAISQTISRVFSALGEKKNRARARLKFLVAKLGIEEFQRLVKEERQKQPHDPRWADYLTDIDKKVESPKEQKESQEGSEGKEDYLLWLKQNTIKQKQKDYFIVHIKLPLGDITATQLRALADMSRKYSQENIRTTVEQNIALRWVRKENLPVLYQELKKAHIGEIGVSDITDIVACPGTDTCKLGISSSRGLASELRQQFQTGQLEIDEIIRALKIKVSGCFNSCSQHHLADLGFYGVSRKIGGRTVPHFQVVLGGQWENNGGVYGLPILAIPSKNIPKVVERMASSYKNNREGSESFHNYIKRLGKVEAKKILQDLSQVPEYQNDSSFYSDWRDPREYTTGDMGIGECAGEVVNRIDMDLALAERELFEAQILLEKKVIPRSRRIGLSIYAKLSPCSSQDRLPRRS